MKWLVDLSGLKSFHVHIAPTMRSDTTCTWCLNYLNSSLTWNMERIDTFNKLKCLQLNNLLCTVLLKSKSPPLVLFLETRLSPWETRCLARTTEAYNYFGINYKLACEKMVNFAPQEHRSGLLGSCFTCCFKRNKKFKTKIKTALF